jgi:HEAT repeat protein
MFRGILSRFRSRPLAKVSVSQLTGVCDAYWASLTQPPRRGIARPDYSEYVQALNELANRDREIVPWVFCCLDRLEYDAREQAAFLLGELARRGELDADQLTAAIEGLTRMAKRPWQEDAKELQANSAAVDALGKTNDPRALPVLQEILLSPDWAEDDLSWDAACILGRLVGESFEDADDPREAARGWIHARNEKAG